SGKRCIVSVIRQYPPLLFTSHKYPFYSVSKARQIINLHQYAVPTCLHCFCRPASPSRNDGRAACHRLHRWQVKSLASTRRDPHITLRVKFRNFRLRRAKDKFHTVRQLRHWILTAETDYSQIGHSSAQSRNSAQRNV